MFVRNVMVVAVMAAAAKRVPSAPTEDDVQLLAIAPSGLSNEDSALPMAPEFGMAMVQVDVAESLMSLFSSSDAAPAPAKSSPVTVESAALAVDAQAEAAALAASQPGTAADGQKPVDLAMVQMHSAESAVQPAGSTLATVGGGSSSGGTVVSVRLASELQTVSVERASAESNATAQEAGGDEALATAEAAANGTMGKSRPVEKEHQSILFQAQSGLATMTDSLVQQFQNELELPETRPTKDKRTLAVLTTLVLPAFFGVDRCYLGQYMLGTLKGLTFGGCAFWALFDWCYVMYSCFSQEDTMNAFMFRANFEPSSLHGAFYIALVGVLVSCAVCIRSPDHHHGVRHTHQKI